MDADIQPVQVSSSPSNKSPTPHHTEIQSAEEVNANIFNCRRIDNKFNILEGVQRNWLFIGTSVIMIGCQVLILFVGGRAFSITLLNPAQWGYSLVLGALSIPVGAVIRIIPLEKLWRE